MRRITVLDHGYLDCVDQWGSEEAIIVAARMSTGKGFLGWGPNVCPECRGEPRLCNPKCFKCNGSGEVPGDEKLLRYLWTNKHATPFEMAGLTFEVQAPILVFREWHRHRVPFGYNEMSARYTPLPDVNYVPTVERLMMNSKTNKQAGTIAGSHELTESNAEIFRHCLLKMYSEQEKLYQDALKYGVPKELARVHLPVGRYSRMRATGNLRGWLAFLALRMPENAQYEIRQYANAIGSVVAERFPRTWALFTEGRK